jgi:hypothetical protein
MKTVDSVCEKCGAKILGDAPRVVCPACLLEAGLGLLQDEFVAGVADPVREDFVRPTGRKKFARADQIYDLRWALAVLDQVLAQLADEYRAAGPAAADLFERLQKSLTEEPDRSLADHEFGMTENAVKDAFHRLRRRYRQLLREEIAHTVAVPGDIEDELRHLIAVLRAHPKTARENVVVNPRQWVGPE